MFALIECIGHLEHIQSLLQLPRNMFEVGRMWKCVNTKATSTMRKEDLSVLFASILDRIKGDGWQMSLEHPDGLSMFTGKANWADGSDCISEPHILPLYC
jgi:hypothetical protein